MVSQSTQITKPSPFTNYTCYHFVLMVISKRILGDAIIMEINNDICTILSAQIRRCTILSASRRRCTILSAAGTRSHIVLQAWQAHADYHGHHHNHRATPLPIIMDTTTTIITTLPHLPWTPPPPPLHTTRSNNTTSAIKNLFLSTVGYKVLFWKAFQGTVCERKRSKVPLQVWCRALG